MKAHVSVRSKRLGYLGITYKTEFPPTKGEYLMMSGKRYKIKRVEKHLTHDDDPYEIVSIYI